MGFREMVQNDIALFINTQEFAETHSINLRSVECVVDDSESDKALKYHDGTKTVSLLIYARSSDLSPSVGASDHIEFDGSLYVVSAINEYDGIKVIQLDKPIGKFDKTVSIQSISTIKVNGMPKSTWNNIHTSQAYVRNMSADDMLKLGTIVNKKIIFVKIPYIAGIDTSMRLVFDGFAYAIKSIDNIEYDSVFIDLICEVVDQCQS